MKIYTVEVGYDIFENTEWYLQENCYTTRAGAERFCKKLQSKTRIQELEVIN